MRGVMKNELKLYWSSALKNGRKNFGDWLSPVLCEALSGKKIVYAGLNQCDLVAIGSILARVKNHFWTRTVDIWGTGLIQEKAAFKCRHRIHAVRGWRTAELITNRSIQVAGDPGLLCDLLLPSGLAGRKQYAVGIIPHYADQKNPLINEFILANPGVHRIEIFSGTQDFIRQVAACEVVLSSSLHGLTTADALGVPNGWIRVSDKVRGADFKFKDYYSIFDMDNPIPFPLAAGTRQKDVLRLTESYSRPGLAQIKSGLMRSFPYKR